MKQPTSFHQSPFILAFIIIYYVNGGYLLPSSEASTFDLTFDTHIALYDTDSSKLNDDQSVMDLAEDLLDRTLSSLTVLKSTLSTGALDDNSVCYLTGGGLFLGKESTGKRNVSCRATLSTKHVWVQTHLKLHHTAAQLEDGARSLTLRIDASSQTISNDANGKGREILISMVEAIQQVITNDDSMKSDNDLAMWTITRSKSSKGINISRSKNKISDEQKKLKSSSIESSLETNIVSNPNLTGKERLYSGNSNKLEIWKYNDSTTSQKFLPKNSIYLDGVLKSEYPSYASDAHAEAFIHPAMVSHPNPASILIISDNPLPLIKEVLKYHESVKRVTVVGANLELLKVIREYSDELDNCHGYAQSSNGSDSSSSSCWLDKRIDVVYNKSVEEWIAEFQEIEEHDRGENENCENRDQGNNNGACISVEDDDGDDDDDDDDDEDNISNEGDDNKMRDEFDVQFVDVPFSNSQKSNFLLSKAFHDELSLLEVDDEAILVVNAGYPPSMVDGTDGGGDSSSSISDDETNIQSARDALLRELARTHALGGIDYEVVTVYDEPLSRPFPSAFIIGFKTENSLSNARFFRRNPAATDIDLANRLHPDSRFTINYDGPTHVQYTRPSRSWENWYCYHSSFGQGRQSCIGFLKSIKRKSMFVESQTEVRNDPIKVRGLYAVEDIPANRFISPDDAIWNLHIDEIEHRALLDFTKNYPDAKMYKALKDFFWMYGYEADTLGSTGWSVSLASNATFVNHACSKEEQNVASPTHWYLDNDGNWENFNPVISRREVMATVLITSTRDIKAGEEILQDYSSMVENRDVHPEWDEFLAVDLCQKGVGDILT